MINSSTSDEKSTWWYLAWPQRWAVFCFHALKKKCEYGRETTSHIFGLKHLLIQEAKVNYTTGTSNWKIQAKWSSISVHQDGAWSQAKSCQEAEVVAQSEQGGPGMRCQVSTSFQEEKTIRQDQEKNSSKHNLLDLHVCNMHIHGPN